MDLSTMVLEEKKSILLTFDVEDWFQVENFKQYIKFSTWYNFDLRVEKNIHYILDVLDSFPFSPKATFFVLGWIARRLPDLVREIHSRGHEVASHGYDHHLCTKIKKNDLSKDLVESRILLEDIISEKVTGYRAPSFAVNDRILELIRSSGYIYDSSFNSFAGHGRYGTIDLSVFAKQNGYYHIDNCFYEIPVSNLDVFGRVFPLGGGGYFRLLPFSLFKLGMKFVLSKESVFVFYSHPWEFDPSQPRIDQATKGFKFRHYVNLHKTMEKLRILLSSFSSCQFVKCFDLITSKVI